MSIYLHPEAQTPENVRQLQRETGCIAVIVGNRVELVQRKSAPTGATTDQQHSQPPLGGDAA